MDQKMHPLQRIKKQEMMKNISLELVELANGFTDIIMSSIIVLTLCQEINQMQHMKKPTLISTQVEFASLKLALVFVIRIARFITLEHISSTFIIKNMKN